MAKSLGNKKGGVTTPSMENGNNKDNEVLVSVATAIKELIEKNTVIPGKIDSIEQSINDGVTKTIDTIVGTFTNPKSAIISSLNTIAVTNTAIAALLYGYKSADFKTTLGSFKSRLSKVGNEPLTQILMDDNKVGNDTQQPANDDVVTTIDDIRTTLNDLNNIVQEISSSMPSESMVASNVVNNTVSTKEHTITSEKITEFFKVNEEQIKNIVSVTMDKLNSINIDGSLASAFESSIKSIEMTPIVNITPESLNNINVKDYSEILNKIDRDIKGIKIPTYNNEKPTDITKSLSGIMGMLEKIGNSISVSSKPRDKKEKWEPNKINVVTTSIPEYISGISSINETLDRIFNRMNDMGNHYTPQSENIIAPQQPTAPTPKDNKKLDYEIKIDITGLDKDSSKVFGDVVKTMIGVMDLNDIETDGENMKQNIYNLIEAVNGLSSIDFSQLNLDFTKDIDAESVGAVSLIIESLDTIVRTLMGDTMAYILVGAFAEDYNTGIKEIAQIIRLVYTNKTSLTNAISGFDFNQLIKVIHMFSLLDDLINIVAGITIKGKLMKGNDKLGELVKSYIQTISSISDDLEENADMLSGASKNMENLAKFYTNFASIFPAVVKTAKQIDKSTKLMDVIINKKDTITKFIDATNEINAKMGDVKLDNLVKPRDGMFKSLTKMILMGSMVLVIAAVAGGLVKRKIGDTFAFCGCLLGFVIAFYGVLMGSSILVSRFGGKNKAEMDMKGISKLILIGAGVLVLGSVVMKLIDKKNLVDFTMTLGGFISALMVMYGVAGRLAKGSISSARDFAILIGISALTLIVPALILKKIPDLYYDIMSFGGILVAFITFTSLAYGLASKTLNRETLTGAKNLAILVAVSAATLFIPALIIRKYPDLLGYITAFGVILIGFIGLFSWVSKTIQKIKASDLIKSGLIMAGIGIVIGIASISLLMIHKVSKSFGNFGELLKSIGMMAVGIASMAVIVGALGALTMIPMVTPMLIAGGILVGGIAGVTILAASAMMTIRKATEGLKNSEEIVNMASMMFTCIGGLIWCIAQAVDKFEPGQLRKVGKMLDYTKQLSEISTTLVDAIKTVSELKGPDGKQMSPELFEDFGTRISTLMSAMIDSLSSALTQNTENINKLKKGKVRKFVGIIGELGESISSIVGGFKDLVMMKFPVYDKETGKIIGYNDISSLSDSDLEIITNNLVKILEMPLQAMSEAFENATDKSLFWMSKIRRESKTMLNVSGAISDIISTYLEMFKSDDMKNANLDLTVYQRNLEKIITSGIQGLYNALYIKDNNGNTAYQAIKPLSENIAKNIEEYKNVIGKLNEIVGAYNELESINEPMVDDNSIPKIQGIVNVLNKVSEIGMKNSDVKKINNALGVLENLKDVVLRYNKIQSSLNDVIITDIETKMTSLFDNIKVIKKHMGELTGFMGLSTPDVGSLTKTKTAFEMCLGIVKDTKAIYQNYAGINKVVSDSNFAVPTISLPDFKNILEDETITKLEREVKATKEFVKTMDNINVSKVQSINELAMSMNKIAENFDIENLVEVINDKLTGTLAELSSQLGNASSMEQSRIATVQKLTKDLKDIMNTKINISVKPESVQQSYGGFGGGYAFGQPVNMQFNQPGQQTQTPYRPQETVSAPSQGSSTMTISQGQGNQPTGQQTDYPSPIGNADYDETPTRHGVFDKSLIEDMQTKINEMYAAIMGKRARQ